MHSVRSDSFAVARAAIGIYIFAGLFNAFPARNAQAESVIGTLDTSGWVETRELSPARSARRLIHAGDVLSFSFGVNSSTWSLNSSDDAFRFTVDGTSGEKKIPLLDSVLRPKVTSSDRGWQSREIPLSKFAGQVLTIDIRTTVTNLKTQEVRPVGPSGAFISFRIGHFKRNPTDYNIVLISIDTLRFDRLGIGGNTRPTSPHIDKFANDSVWFSEAIAQAPWTLPSHMSIFTGLYPSRHGMTIRFYKNPPALSASVKTLTETLRDNGFLTAAYTGGAYMSATYGFFRGFDYYSQPAKWFRGDSTSVFSAGQAYIQKHAQERFFLFLHTYDIHGPYLYDELLSYGLTKPLRKRIDEQYDSGIVKVDNHFGEFMASLQAENLRKRTIVILVSDHGEELLQRGYSLQHGHTLYDDQLRIPLIFACPGLISPRRIDRFQAQHIDIAPTVLELLKIPPKGMHLEGRSLAGILRGGPVPETSVAISEGIEFGVQDFISVRVVDKKRYRLIYSPSSEAGIIPEDIDLADRSNFYWRYRALSKFRGKEFYDLDADPAELHNISGTGLPEENHARSILDLFNESATRKGELTGQGSSVEISEDLRQQLRSLGY